MMQQQKLKPLRTLCTGLNAHSAVIIMLFAGQCCQPQAWLKEGASPGDIILLYCRLQASLPGYMPHILPSNIHLVAKDHRRPWLSVKARK